MKKILILPLLLACTCICHAQTKVFKEVSEDISSHFAAIHQDNTLLGYVVFTTLEKVSADSFNYKLTIMDENLNDIGTVNFRDIKLHFQSIAFEQDVLCVSYFKSNFVNVEFPSKREHKKAYENAQSWVFLQFLNLEGKIIGTSEFKSNIAYKREYYSNKPRTYNGAGTQKQAVQVTNIPDKGFACFYREETKNTLLVFNTQGQLTCKKPVNDEAEYFGLMSSGQNVYLLVKKKDQFEDAGYEIFGYSPSDSTTFPKYTLKDKQGNPLKVLRFANDPVSGKPYVTGYIINPNRGHKTGRPKLVKKGAYYGLFTINLNGPKKSDFQEVYSYWNDGSQSFISKKGRFDNKSVAWYVGTFKDFDGNTYFTGSTYKTNTNWGAVAGSIITVPTVYGPILFAGMGYTRARELSPVVIKQSPRGVLTLDNTVQANKQKASSGRLPFSYLTSRKYYCMPNTDKKCHYVIIDDKKDIFVYNVNQKKVVRTIPHKDGNASINVYPAKEGHIMVSEYNQKERSTRYSIEAL